MSNNPSGSVLRRRLTMRDVAARTGLSTATISRVINGKSWVATATRDRVLAALDEMGYILGASAAGLRTGHTGLLGLIIGEPRDPITLSAMRGALEAATPFKYGVVVYMAGSEQDYDRIYSDVMARGWVDGAVVLWPRAVDEAAVRRIAASGLPLVLIEPVIAMPGVATVYADAFSDGYCCTRYLLDHGHRRIGLCASHPLNGIEARYLDGYYAALAEEGLPVDHALALSAGHTYETGYHVATRWLQMDHAPTGMCFHSDMAALGAMAAARDRGVHVPEDLSVIGYDDTQMASWIKPELTTLRGRRVQEARAACEVLLGLIGGGGAPAEPLLLRTDLVVRQSARRPTHA